MAIAVRNKQVIRSWDAPSEWVASLREIDPIRDGLSYLHLEWRAFVHDEPIQRWMLYEMVPLEMVDEQVITELRGPDPDTIPESCPIVSHTQWALYQKTGRHARPCWVIQGANGGHPYAYTQDMRNAAKIAHGRNPNVPLEAPMAGSLPYAPFDARVRSQILRMNKLLAAGMNLDTFRRLNTGLGAKSQHAEMQKRYRAELVKWIGEQAEEPTEHFKRAFKTGESESLPISDKDWEKADEIATNNYIEFGSYSDVGFTP